MLKTEKIITNISNISSRIFTWWKQLRCKHENWDCDTQIRTIECRECGKRSWLKEYRSLY